LSSFVIYRRAYDAGFAVPYNVSVVQLEEGPRLISTVLEEPEALKIDMPLKAAFDGRGRIVFSRTTAPLSKR
jgi:uncharacterized OB-fold protein